MAEIKRPISPAVRVLANCSGLPRRTLTGSLWILRLSCRSPMQSTLPGPAMAFFLVARGGHDEIPRGPARAESN